MKYLLLWMCDCQMCWHLARLYMHEFELNMKTVEWGETIWQKLFMLQYGTFIFVLTSCFSYDIFYILLN